MNKKVFYFSVVLLTLLFLVLAGTYFVLEQRSVPQVPVEQDAVFPEPGSETVQTEEEAELNSIVLDQDEMEFQSLQESASQL